MWWKFQNINRKDFGTLRLLSALESRVGGGWAASELLPDTATDLEDGPIKLSGVSSFFRADLGLLGLSVVETLGRGASPGRKARP